MAVLIAATVWYAFNLVERTKAETDLLLRNILPDSIAESLKANLIGVLLMRMPT